jgi:two-component system, response regulator
MKPKIAIIEDDVIIAEMYQFKLQQTGYDVKVALNGKLGLDMVAHFHPDLLLLDLMMPEMTGDEVLEKIRAEEWGSDIRVVILTNISKDEAPSKLRLLNVDRYIVKAHYTPAQVVQLVGEVLRGNSKSGSR